MKTFIQFYKKPNFNIFLKKEIKEPKLPLNQLGRQVSKSTAHAVDNTKTRTKSSLTKQKKNKIKNYQYIVFAYLYASIIKYEEGAEYQKRKKMNFIYFHFKHFRNKGSFCKRRVGISTLIWEITK